MVCVLLNNNFVDIHVPSMEILTYNNNDENCTSYQISSSNIHDKWCDLKSKMWQS